MSTFNENFTGTYGRGCPFVILLSHRSKTLILKIYSNGMGNYTVSSLSGNLDQFLLSGEGNIFCIILNNKIAF